MSAQTAQRAEQPEPALYVLSDLYNADLRRNGSTESSEKVRPALRGPVPRDSTNKRGGPAVAQQNYKVVPLGADQKTVAQKAHERACEHYELTGKDRK